MELTTEVKDKIDKMSYEEMLRVWRFSPSELNSIFQGESGEYFKKVMFEKEKTVDNVAISKKIGWEGKEDQAKEEFHVVDKATAGQFIVTINTWEKAKGVLQDKIKEIENKIDKLREKHEPELQAYVMENLPAKAKSIEIEGRKAGFRTFPAKLDIVDKEKVIEWAKKNVPEAITTKTTESLLKNPLTDKYKATEKLPPGTEWIEEKEVFYIK